MSEGRPGMRVDAGPPCTVMVPSLIQLLPPSMLTAVSITRKRLVCGQRVRVTVTVSMPSGTEAGPKSVGVVVNVATSVQG